MYVIPMSQDKQIEIRAPLDEHKSPSITVTVPGTTLFNMKFEDFVEMVADYAVKRADLASTH